MSVEGLELLVDDEGGRVRLRSPGVGFFTGAIAAGRALVEGERAGWLVTLGRATPLLVPRGVSGVVRNESPERVREPVGWNAVLYELEPWGAGGPAQGTARDGSRGAASSAASAEGEGALVLRSPQTGRFYHRASPAEPPLAPEGTELQAGSPVGLIEVMKTFTHVVYRADAGLPTRARVVRLLARDGADVTEGDPLVQLEPA